MIEIKGLVELTIVTLIVKLIVKQWYPPVQKSLQAIFCLTIGTGIGVFINPSKEGFITALIGSGFAFYGGELKSAFYEVKDDFEDVKSKDKIQSSSEKKSSN